MQNLFDINRHRTLSVNTLLGNRFSKLNVLKTKTGRFLRRGLVQRQVKNK